MSEYDDPIKSSLIEQAEIKKDNFKEKLHNIPLWLINLISILSSIVTVLTPIIGVVSVAITGGRIKSKLMLFILGSDSLAGYYKPSNV